MKAFLRFVVRRRLFSYQVFYREKTLKSSKGKRQRVSYMKNTSDKKPSKGIGEWEQHPLIFHWQKSSWPFIRYRDKTCYYSSKGEVFPQVLFGKKRGMTKLERAKILPRSFADRSPSSREEYIWGSSLPLLGFQWRKVTNSIGLLQEEVLYWQMIFQILGEDFSKNFFSWPPKDRRHSAGLKLRETSRNR